MSEGEDQAGEIAEAAGAAPPAPVSIFINYRHDDTAWPAHALRDALVRRFGAEHVFMDTESINAGEPWLQMIKEHNDGSSVFLALIGHQWLNLLEQRSKDRGKPDIVRLEIEDALRRGSRAHVIPVLVDEAPMPRGDALPSASLRALATRQAVPLRQKNGAGDVTHLLEAIERIAETGRDPDALPERRATPAHEPATVDLGAPPANVASSPDARHFEEVAACLIDANRVEPIVVFLGSGVNASDRGDEAWTGSESGRLPDADELAEHLARKFRLGSQSLDLAQASQYVYLTAGRPRLYQTVASTLSATCPPTSVHHFLARLPHTIEQLGYPDRYQLIVTSNYDDALERAFDEANEPYDLAVYIASGERRGQFVHIPYDDAPQFVEDASNYRRLPIGAGDDIPVKRTLIVKIYGAVESDTRPWRDNYVITEDQYIDYLVDGKVPIEITDQIKASHCLFLGYTMRDWNLRVFLQRLWRGQPLEAESWAIERSPDAMERRFWKSLGGISLFASPLGEYVRELETYLLTHAGSPREP